MVWRCQKQLTRGGAYTDVDLNLLPAGKAKLSIGYSHASQLTFDVIAPEHTTPIERLAFIRIWDDDTGQTSADPLFEGFVESVSPAGDGNRIRYTAFDPTYRANNIVTLMSLPYVEIGRAHV